MNGKWKYAAGLVVALLIVALSVASVAAAPANPGTPGPQNGAQAGAGVGYGRGMMGAGGAYNMPSVVADVTELSVEDVIAQHQEGKSWAQIAEAEGVTKDVLVAGIVEQRQAQLNERVSAGTLTAEQAELVVERMQQQVAAAVDQTGATGPRMGSGAQGNPGDCPALQGQSSAQQGQSQGVGPGSRGAGRGGMMRGAGLGLNR